MTESSNEIIRIKLIAAWNLANKNIGLGPLTFFSQKCAPYVQIDLCSIDGKLLKEKVYVTQTKKNTLNPKWNEEVLLKVNPKDQKVLFSIFDENDKLPEHDFLGMFELSLTEIHRENWPKPILTKCYDLKPRDDIDVNGELELYHAYLDPNSQEYQKKMEEEGVGVKTTEFKMTKEKLRKNSLGFSSGDSDDNNAIIEDQNSQKENEDKENECDNHNDKDNNHTYMIIHFG